MKWFARFMVTSRISFLFVVLFTAYYYTTVAYGWPVWAYLIGALPVGVGIGTLGVYLERYANDGVDHESKHR